MPKVGRYPESEATPVVMRTSMFEIVNKKCLQLIKPAAIHHQYLALDAVFEDVPAGDYIIMVKNIHPRKDPIPSALSAICSSLKFELASIDMWMKDILKWFPQHAIYGSVTLAPHGEGGQLKRGLSLLDIPQFSGLVLENPTASGMAH